MALETAGFISDLNNSNPTATDGLAQGDDHLRLLKTTIKATFPNFTATPLSSTQAAIDTVVATVNTTGVSVLADAGVNFKTNSTDGLRNPAPGEVDVEVNGVPGLKVAAATVTAPAALAVVGAFAAATVSSVGAYGGGTGQLVPVGGTLVWWDDVLPTEGGYAWANGQIIASANTVCPVLLARWGARFGGNGTTTMGVPDMREVAPYGKSNMGATITPGRITNYALTTLGSFIGACLHVLTTGEMPSHTHTGTTGGQSNDHTHNAFTQNTGNAFQAGGFSGPFNAQQATTGTSADHSHNFTTAASGSGGSHDNVSPGVACNWIIRLA
jgi:microcystin-dependent protein